MLFLTDDNFTAGTKDSEYVLQILQGQAALYYNLNKEPKFAICGMDFDNFLLDIDMTSLEQKANAVQMMTA